MTYTIRYMLSKVRYYYKYLGCIFYESREVIRSIHSQMYRPSLNMDALINMHILFIQTYTYTHIYTHRYTTYVDIHLDALFRPWKTILINASVSSRPLVCVRNRFSTVRTSSFRQATKVSTHCKEKEDKEPSGKFL